VDLRNITFPHLASLLRHGTPIPIHGGEGNLMTVNIADESELAGQTVADIFERFPELLAVAIIRNHHIELPRGSSRLEGGDQLLLVATGTREFDVFEGVARARKR
jgi:Trk K+ transport system NAD-binding subunit